MGPTESYCKRGSFRIKESGLLFQCLITEPGGMFYLQYNKPLAEHFPRPERSQGRTLFPALSFLWQTPSSPIQTHLCTLSLHSNHNPHLKRNLRQGLKLKTSQWRTLFCSPQFPSEPLCNGTFQLALSLSPRANPSGVLHRAAPPAMGSFSLTQKRLRVELSSSWASRTQIGPGSFQGCTVKGQEVMGTTFSEQNSCEIPASVLHKRGRHQYVCRDCRLNYVTVTQDRLVSSPALQPYSVITVPEEGAVSSMSSKSL